MMRGEELNYRAQRKDPKQAETHIIIAQLRVILL